MGPNTVLVLEIDLEVEALFGNLPGPGAGGLFFLSQLHNLCHGSAGCVVIVGGATLFPEIRVENFAVRVAGIGGDGGARGNGNVALFLFKQLTSCVEICIIEYRSVSK